MNAVYENKELLEVLTSVLGKQNLTYHVLEDQIILSIAAPINMEQSQTLIQEKSIKGVVTSDEGFPMAGVSVTVEGSNRGVVTNFNGEYTINVRDEDELLKFIY